MDMLWADTYRPLTVEQTILPDRLKTMFQGFIDNQSLPNLIFHGSSGLGKTTVAKALCEQLGYDYIVINASKEGNIDTLRTIIQQFASTMSLISTRKCVVFDEADHLNPISTQPALRNFMDEFSGNCSFIFTCNYVERITDHIQSRCSVIDFRPTKKEVVKLASQFFKSVVEILDKENVKYEKPVVAQVIEKYYPDLRRILNELQAYSACGVIDVGILSNLENNVFKQLFSLLKGRDFTNIRKWVSDNYDNNHNDIFRKIYDNSGTYVQMGSIPMLVVMIAKYQYQAAFVADQELNIVALLAEMMVELDYL